MLLSCIMGLHAHPRPAPGNRIFNRLRLGAAASLVLTHETCACLLDDISLTGARLRVERMLPKGRTALLVFHELRVFSSVVWSDHGECGLRFDTPLELEDMQGMLWITENRNLYERICREGHALEWTEGIGD